jgi:hypothetical protein
VIGTFEVGVADLYFDEEPERQLTRLETDPSLGTVLRAVEEKLDLLEADPSASAVRPRRLTNGLWYVIAHSTDEAWAILREPHPEPAGDVAIRYLGPATFD